MSKRVILTISSGNFETGFTINLRITEDRNLQQESQYEGELLAAPDIPLLLKEWQQAFEHKMGYREPRIKSLATGNSIRYSCKQATDKLVKAFQSWLNRDSSLSNIRSGLYKNLHPNDEIRFIIQTKDEILQKLPWHLWSFFDDYPQAEIAIAKPCYETVTKPLSTRKKPRILVILGDDRGIDLEADRQFINDLQKLNAETVFCVKPQRQEFDRLIRDEKGWDILFFAGHSQTTEAIGRIFFNEGESITISDLKYALQQAISQGLQIAIFNSCDGLGIANELARLNIPQIILMRYPVPDTIAREFLLNFLQAYTGGKALYTAVREARERLQGLETKIPCASWIPIIYQNPTVIPVTWRKLGGWYSLATENLFVSQQRPDYLELRDLLRSANWREADLKTRTIILKISDREPEGWLDQRAILSLPSQDVRAIDHLWLKYSKGHFGLSVQKQIWDRVEGNTIAFGDCVGWRKDRNWLLYYSDFNFSLAALMGHLPSYAKWCSGWRIYGEVWSQEFGSLGKLMEWVFLPGHYASSLILSEERWNSLLKDEEYKQESAISPSVRRCAIALFDKLDC